MRFKTFIGYLAVYVLIVFRHGYVFGSDDQSEMLPYAKYLIDNQLYLKDFYIQSISAHIPNERFVFSKVLSFFGTSMEIAVFTLHALTTLALVAGLRRISAKWFVTDNGQWLAILLPILFLYNINLGGNELYYNTLNPSYIAQVLGVWAFAFLFEANPQKAYPIVLIATFIHPLIGVQVWLLIAVLHAFMKWEGKTSETISKMLIINVLYMITAGFYIFKIKYNYGIDNTISNIDFLNIMEFRAAHHYFPSYFPVQNWLILLPLFTLFYVWANRSLKLLVILIALGCVVYSLGIYVFKSPSILSVQWFATTVWLKTFGLMYILSVVEKRLIINKSNIFVRYKTLIFNVLCIFSILSLILMTPQYRLLKNKRYDFFISDMTHSEAVDISKLAKARTPLNAVFVIPADFTAFRYWSERSCFIDYKATNHRQAAFAEWYKRIQLIYNINIKNRLEKGDLPVLGTKHFEALNEEDFLQLRDNQGITHILISKSVVLNFPIIAQNEMFIIYEIK